MRLLLVVVLLGNNKRLIVHFAGLLVFLELVARMFKASLKRDDLHFSIPFDGVDFKELVKVLLELLRVNRLVSLGRMVMVTE